MPTYRYRCTDDTCAHEFEIKQSISDDVLTECPECQEDTLNKIINSNGNFVLKGPGWFKNGGY